MGELQDYARRLPPALHSPMALSHPQTEALTGRIIAAAIEVHRELGPGLLESTYEDGLCWELTEAGVGFVRQPLLPVFYKGARLGACYRPDLIVEASVIVEVKCASALAPVHTAQLLTYLKHSNLKLGLLLNFHSPTLVSGLKRVSL